MYYESYGDYMRNQTGYQNIPNQYYNSPTYPNQFDYMRQNQSVNNLYPELYTEINKKIESNCVGNDYRLNEENVNRLTEQIYADYKDNTPENTRQADNRRNSNSVIRDLIRILVIKFLLSRQRRQSPYQMMPPMPNNYYNGLY